jgi:hypothetical protein
VVVHSPASEGDGGGAIPFALASENQDLAAAYVDVPVGPAMPGYYFVPVSVLKILTSVAGAQTTAPTYKCGNDATRVNVESNDTFILAGQFTAGAPSQARVTPVTPSVLIDMTTGLKMSSLVQGAGTGGYVCVGKLIVSGFLIQV